MLSSGLLHWGALAMAVALAYTAWYSKRSGDCPRDTLALRICCGISFLLAAALAVMAYSASE